jgi:hypothetical protein
LSLFAANSLPSETGVILLSADQHVPRHTACYHSQSETGTRVIAS